jgi:hypothetical protein
MKLREGDITEVESRFCHISWVTFGTEVELGVPVNAMLATITCTRQDDPEDIYTLPYSSNRNEVEEALAERLSSPVQSYQFCHTKDGVTFKHKTPYRERLKVSFVL